MSTARLVPETWKLTGDDAKATLLQCGRRQLLRDAFQRLRFSDGFSHARSLAFLLSLAAIQGIIAMIGVARAFGERRISTMIVRVVEAAAPGPVADLLTTAIRQAHSAGSQQHFTGLTLGTIGWLVTTTIAMGQLERGLNRLYGVEQDRPSVQKYGRALVLAVSVGTLMTMSVGLLAFGRTLRHSIESSLWARAFDAAAWPVGLGLSLAGVAVLFRTCPRRQQPAWSWLAYGAAVAVALWGLATLGLGLFFAHSSSFGQTYGPLAGVVALLLWSLLSSIAVFFGAAIAAQLEAVRAQARSPQDTGKIARSEPDAARALAPTGGLRPA